MRHWSPWDEQLLRALRGEFRNHAPALSFAAGVEGGVAVFHRTSEFGLWIAASRHNYYFVHADGRRAMDDCCEIMDIIPVSRELFAEMLDGSDSEPH